MKRKLLVFVMSAFVVGVFAQTNLMVGQNGGFEDGTIDKWRMLEINADGFFAYVLGDMPAEALGNVAIIDDSFEGDKALEFTWPAETPGLVEILMDKWDGDKFLPVTAGNDYIFKAAGYASEGAGNVLRMAAYFFAADSTSGVADGDLSDETWILGDFYEEHSWTVTAPADAAFVSIGFRVFGTDGARWPATQVVTVIDNIQLWENYDATAVNHKTAKPDVSLYPNPVESSFQIITNATMKNVKIYDVSGQMVKEITRNFNQINVEELSTGLYIVKIDSEVGTMTQKMLKK